MSEVLVRLMKSLNGKDSRCNAFCNEDVHSMLVYSDLPTETTKALVPRYYGFAMKVIDIVAAPEAPATPPPKKSGWYCSLHDLIEHVPCPEGKTRKPFLVYFKWADIVDPFIHGFE